MCWKADRRFLGAKKWLLVRCLEQVETHKRFPELTTFLRTSYGTSSFKILEFHYMPTQRTYVTPGFRKTS